MVKKNSYNGNRNINKRKSKNSSKKSYKNLSKKNKIKSNNSWDSFADLVDNASNQNINQNYRKNNNNNNMNNLQNFNEDAMLINHMVPVNQKYEINNFGVNEKDLVSPSNLINGIDNFNMEQNQNHIDQMPMGQMPMGQMPMGQMPMGQMPMGQMPYMQGQSFEATPMQQLEGMNTPTNNNGSGFSVDTNN